MFIDCHHQLVDPNFRPGGSVLLIAQMEIYCEVVVRSLYEKQPRDAILLVSVVSCFRYTRIGPS